VPRPFTPELERPAKSLDVPEPLYEVKVALNPPLAVLLGNVVPGELVRGKYNKLRGAACPTVPDSTQPAKTAIAASDIPVRPSLDRTV
jgi:hypothetical protein